MALYTIHLFAGAGGGVLADLLLGHTPIAACEIEDYPRRVLLQRQLDGILPVFPVWDDVRTLRSDNPECAEAFAAWKGVSSELAICGGFPCQDISCAGKGAGIDGARSGMWVEMARIIREVGPLFVFVENSPMLTSRGLGRVLGDLAAMGYDARWGVLGAKSVGGFHGRERVWILAIHPDSDGAQEAQHKQPVLETKDAYSGYARHLAGTVGLDGIRGMVDAYVQRDGNAVASAVDRFRAIGNGQVPSVAALAWEILSQK